MKFKPLSESETTTNYLLPEGNYEVRVEDAQEGVSKAGNPQIKLKLKVIGEHKTITVFDYLGSTSKKLRNFCQNMDLLDKYMNGEITDDDCCYKTGYAKVKVERNAQYGDQNKIAFYLAKTETNTTAKENDDFINDDVPF